MLNHWAAQTRERRERLRASAGHCLFLEEMGCSEGILMENREGK
jgi:hypothetical protein